MRKHASIVLGLLCITTSLSIASFSTEMKHASQPSPSGIGKAERDENGCSKVDWEYWEKTNEDIVGWIDIPDLRISLPIAKEENHEKGYYLKHDARQGYNVYGCPYVDSSCKRGLDSRNALILGHHMNDGSMFSALATSTLTKKPIKAFIQTRSWTEEIKLTRKEVLDASKERIRTSFESWEEFEVWAEKKDLTDAGTMPTHAVMLVTCSYGVFANERTAVFGRVEQRWPSKQKGDPQVPL